MKMKLTFACAAALLAAGAFAEDDTAEASVEATGEPASEGAEAKKKEDHNWFFTLPLCRRVQGGGEVKTPNTEEWKAIEEGRFYPLGTAFRANREGGSVHIAFGKTCMVTIENGSSFATRQQPLTEASRSVVLTGGEVAVTLPSNLPEGLFTVTNSSFVVCDMNGESRFTYEDKGDGFVSDIRCVTGSLSVKGRHYSIPKMRAADVVRIRTTHDELETVLYGKSGDYIVKLNRGEWYAPETQEDGTVKDVVCATPLDWHLSVSTRVQINRAVSSADKRISVCMMTFDSAGIKKNEFAYAEGRPEINTGELTVRSLAENADVAKRAAEVTTEAAATEAEAVVEEEVSTSDF